MYLLAMRISELLHYSKKFNHALNLDDIKMAKKSVYVTIKSGKHNMEPMVYKVNCTSRLLWHIKEYLRLRGNSPGPLFIHESGSTMKRNFFTKQLKEDLLSMGFNDADFNTHSFRVGRTSDLAVGGRLTDRSP